jgi:hypothetical protein
MQDNFFFKSYICIIHDFLMTGMWIFTTLLPLMVLNNKKEDKPLCTRDYVGWGLWALGFLFETIADHQKSAFKGNPDNAVSSNCVILCFSCNILMFKRFQTSANSNDLASYVLFFVKTLLSFVTWLTVFWTFRMGKPFWQIGY